MLDTSSMKPLNFYESFNQYLQHSELELQVSVGVNISDSFIAFQNQFLREITLTVGIGK